MRHLVVGSWMLAAACGSSGDGLEGKVPDFSLDDVNTTSSTFDQTVSPRDHLGRVSVWYFGHST